MQAVGGVNEKIEGFFDSCMITGLTGTQGVIIPCSNANDLMLDERVVEAVTDDTFHIWAIDNVSEGIRILMDRDAGERLSDFTFTPGSVYDTVDKQIQKAALDARRFFAEKDDLMV